MKNRFTHFIVLGSICLFTACAPDEEKKPFCLGDIYKRNLDAPGYVQGDAGTYSCYYSSLYVNNLCNRDNPMIEFEVFLENPDMQAVKTGYVQEEGSSTIHEYPLETHSNDDMYTANVGHVYEMVSGHTPGALNLQLKFQFPFQGSPAADSIYFFSNLNQMNIKVSSLAQGLP